MWRRVLESDAKRHASSRGIQGTAIEPPTCRQGEQNCDTQEPSEPGCETSGTDRSSHSWPSEGIGQMVRRLQGSLEHGGHGENRTRKTREKTTKAQRTQRIGVSPNLFVSLVPWWFFPVFSASGFFRVLRVPKNRCEWGVPRVYPPSHATPLLLYCNPAQALLSSGYLAQ